MAGAAPAGRLTLLSGWALRIGPQRVWTTPAVQRLVALLGLRGTQRRATVAGRLFPGQPQRAPARLRDLLWQAARSDPMLNTVIVCDGPDLSLSPRVGVDVHELRTAVDGLRAGSPDALRRLPERIDLLAGWDEPWVVAERDALRATVGSALLDWSQSRLGLGDPQAALVAAEHASLLDPLDEPALRCEVQAHLALGDVARALRRFDDFSRMLRTELGVSPEPLTHDLVSPYRGPRPPTRLPRRSLVSR